VGDLGQPGAVTMTPSASMASAQTRAGIVEIAARSLAVMAQPTENLQLTAS